MNKRSIPALHERDEAVVRNFVALTTATMITFMAVTPSQAQAVTRRSIRVVTEAATPFPLSASSCHVLRDVLVKYRSDQSLYALDGVIVAATGRYKGRIIGDLSWTRSAGPGTKTSDRISTDWTLDKDSHAVTNGQKVNYQVTAVLENDDGRIRTVSSSWYPSRINARC
jgi:hypothetical protein